MSLLRLTDVSKCFGAQEVLKDISLVINPGEKIGLVGNNGAGKTTLARIIAGKTLPDSGSLLLYKKELRIGYLPQDKSAAVLEGRKDFLRVASQLGLKSVSDWGEEKLGGLSGGEKTKLALAQVWTTSPDLLILDEPTNHMDIQGVEWLAQEMKTFPGAALIISHDRWFLDQAVTRIYELEWGNAREYLGNYTFYREEKERQLASNLHRYQAEQREQRRIEEEIIRLRQWSAKGHRQAGKDADVKFGAKEYGRKKVKKRDQQIKSKIKMLDRKKKEGLERPRGESRPRFEFAAAGKRGRGIIEAIGLGKGFGSKILFANSDFFVQRGEKVGLIGPNGCGKTTLLRIFLGLDRQDAGELWCSPTLKAGVLSQDLDDLDPQKTALELMGARQKEQITRVRTLLANMGFDADMVVKPVASLSLGERVRLKLAALIDLQSDLLVLDEPTNHLDLHSREKLEETLTDYDGTVLIASHDRYLLEKVCDRLLVFADGIVQRLPHGFKRFVDGKEQRGDTRKIKKEMLLIIETKMAWIVSELGKYTPEDQEYRELDQEFAELIQKKRELSH